MPDVQPPAPLHPPYGDAGWAERDGAGRNVLKWLAAILFFAAMLALLASLQAYQVTSEGTAKQTLRRAVAALTEIDPLIEKNHEDLRTRAESVEADDTLELRDFPVSVPLTRDEALRLSPDELRDRLLDGAADRLYEEGTGTLRADAEGAGDVGLVSVAGLTDNGLRFLRERNHTALATVTAVLAVVCAALAGWLALLCRGFGRLAAVGGVVLAASAPLLLASLALRLYMRVLESGEDEYLKSEFLDIGQELAWLPIRNGLAFTLAGLLLVAAGWALARWADAREPSYGSLRDAPEWPSRPIR